MVFLSLIFKKRTPVRRYFVENQSIIINNSMMYSDKQELISEIPFNKIEEIYLISQNLDVASTEHIINIKLFDDSYVKDFVIWDKGDRQFAKELIEALNINFEAKHFLSRKEIFLMIYPKIEEFGLEKECELNQV